MTALRSLMVELGLADGVSNKLRGIDAHVSGLESGLTGTKKEFSALERATTNYGYTAVKELSGVGKGISELDKQVVNHADVTAKATDEAVKSWTKVGAAIGAVGVAGEAFVRSQQDNYFIAGKVAYMTGLERREVSALASELTTIGMPIDDVHGLFEIGAKQGLKTPDEFREYVTFFDNFGTAAEEDPLGLAKQTLGLKSVGIEVKDLTDSYGAFGFMLENTQWKSSQFLGTIGYIARDMDKLDMSIDDVAITLTALDRYRGITPENAQRVLRTAMSGSNGDRSAFYRELRITDDQIAQVQSEYGGGAEYIAMVNEEYAGSQSSLQYLEMELSTVTNLIGADFLPAIGAASAVLGGLSSALLTAASAKYIFAGASIKTLIPSLTAATASAWGFTTALLANPLTWVVVGVVAAGAAIYTLATHWDTVSEKATSAMDWMEGAWDSTVGALASKTEWLTDRMDYLMLLCPITAPIGAMRLLRDNWDEVTGSMGGTWDKLVDTSKQSGAWFTEATKDTLSKATDLFWQYHPLGIVISHWDDITGYLESIDLSDTGRNVLLGFLDGILDVRDQTFDTVLGIGEGIEDTIKDFFGIRSPSKLMQEMGGFVGQGFQLGIDQSMPGTIPLPEVMGQSGTYKTIYAEPTIRDLTGAVGYLPNMSEPAITDLSGVVDYQSRLSETTVPRLSSEIQYNPMCIPPTVENIAGNIGYQNSLDAPEIEDLTGSVMYLSNVVEPGVASLQGLVEYMGTISEPSVPMLSGAVAYQSQISEPTIQDLTCSARYQGVLSTPEIPTLPGNVAYRTQISEPTIQDLYSQAMYQGILSEPMVPALSGNVDYQSHVSGPTVHDLAGTIVYESALDRPEISDLAGRVDYLSHVIEPVVPALHGTVDYFGGMYTPAEDVGPSLPDVDAFGDYTPERDVQYFTSHQGDIVYSTEINIDGTGQDSRELAATIDRRIRKTFDRNAETYFARQRRRMA